MTKQSLPLNLPANFKATNAEQQYHTQVQQVVQSLTQYGSSEERPRQNLFIGQPYFDTTLNQRIIWNGSQWSDTSTSGSGTSSVSSSPTTIINQTGVTSFTSGSGLSTNTFVTGAVSVTNTGVTSLAGTSNQITASAATGAITLSLPSTLVLPGSISSTQFLLGGSACSIVAGPGAGTGPTVSVTGKANAGTITVTTGTAPSANAVIATITYPASYSTASFPVFSWAGINASSTLSDIWISGSTGSFTLNVKATNLTATTTYVWNFIVTGH
jgi:hypothetical protein